jgi:peroxiredoxin Q/BCP
VDDPAANRAFAEKFAFPYPLLSDVDRKVALAYCACETAQDQYARRHTYLIGPDGKIEQAIATKDAAGQAGALLETCPLPC